MAAAKIKRRKKGVDVPRTAEPVSVWFSNGNRITKSLYNQLLVCSTLFHEGSESRAGLCRRTGLPASRLTAICGTLLREGVIRESVVAPASGSGRGRPQTFLEIDLRALGVACVRYDQEHVIGAVADLAGTVRWQRRWDGPFGADAERLLRRIVEALQLAVDAAPEAGVRLAAAGAADPGTVNVAAGRAVRAVNVPGWQDVPVVEKLRAVVDLPVVIERGDGWQALGEVAFGAGQGARHAIFVTLLEGIGGGIVEEGRLLVGRDGSAGEIGHTRVSRGGPQCGCGGRGCLEAHVAPARLVALWRGLPPDQAQQVTPRGETSNDDFAQMLRAAREGDARAGEVLREAARALARGLGNAISLLNPERIILGGRFVEAGDLLLEPLKQALPRYALREMLQGTDVRLAELGEASTFLGIAAHVRDRIFAYPRVGACFEENAGETSSPLQGEPEA